MRKTGLTTLCKFIYWEKEKQEENGISEPGSREMGKAVLCLSGPSYKGQKKIHFGEG